MKHWKMTEKDAVIIPCSSKEFKPPAAMQPPGRELHVHKKGGREGGEEKAFTTLKYDRKEYNYTTT